MIRRPPRSTLDRSSAASDVYKRQLVTFEFHEEQICPGFRTRGPRIDPRQHQLLALEPVSYTHLRAHETVLDIVCRLLLEKKKSPTINSIAEVTNTDTADDREITKSTKLDIAVTVNRH